jgi:hypothetical protein
MSYSPDTRPTAPSAPTYDLSSKPNTPSGTSTRYPATPYPTFIPNPSLAPGQGPSNPPGQPSSGQDGSVPTDSSGQDGTVPTTSPGQDGSTATTSPGQDGGSAPSGTMVPTSNAMPTVSDSPATTPNPNGTFSGPSTAPTTEIIGGSGITPTTVFDRSEVDGGIVIVPPPHEATTVVRLEIGYLVEAYTNNTEDFSNDLDWLIFTQSVYSSLSSNHSGALANFAPFRRLSGEHSRTDYYWDRHLLSSSSFLRKIRRGGLRLLCL